MAQPKIRMGIAAPPMPPMSNIRQLLWATRLLRLDSFLVWDHLQGLFPRFLWRKDVTWTAGQSPESHAFFDYQTVLGALARQAGAVRLGVAVTEPVRRQPVVIAQAMLTLAHLTKRAPILGIGAGERENIEPYGLDFSQPVGRLEEALQVVRLCLDGQTHGPLNFEGRHFRLENAEMGLRAPKGRQPTIWVGGLGPRMLRLTGRYGDGWFPLGTLTPEQYGRKLAVVLEAAREAGRDPTAILPALQPYLIVAPTEREARAMLDTKIVRFMGLLAPAEAWRAAGRAHPFGEGFRGIVDFVPERHSRDEIEAAIARVPLELADTSGLLWGTPQQVTAKLRQYGDAGMRYVVPQPVSAMISRRAAFDSLRALRTIAHALAG